jgi:hypothetical protein
VGEPSPSQQVEGGSFAESGEGEASPLLVCDAFYFEGYLKVWNNGKFHISSSYLYPVCRISFIRIAFLPSSIIVSHPKKVNIV